LTHKRCTAKQVHRWADVYCGRKEHNENHIIDYFKRWAKQTPLYAADERGFRVRHTQTKHKPATTDKQAEDNNTSRHTKGCKTFINNDVSTVMACTIYKWIANNLMHSRGSATAKIINADSLSDGVISIEWKYLDIISSTNIFNKLTSRIIVILVHLVFLKWDLLLPCGLAEVNVHKYWNRKTLKPKIHTHTRGASYATWVLPFWASWCPSFILTNRPRQQDWEAKPHQPPKSVEMQRVYGWILSFYGAGGHRCSSMKWMFKVKKESRGGPGYTLPQENVISELSIWVSSHFFWVLHYAIRTGDTRIAHFTRNS
jgi:hypothetical protein